MNQEAPRRRRVRCAIYTRKSTSEGLDQEFNTLDAQREAAEAFITSQKQAGWKALPARYDDGGFTGGNLDRPALEQLLADVGAGQVDCVVVYKVDRLSRSLLDFARLMEKFDRHEVSFVSVTQQFNTAHSMGRLTLNILLSFAQFEREIIGERTRDKMGAARRKGKWLGSTPVLGYDIDRPQRRLVVNPQEAERVRTIFALYVKHGSLIPTVTELARRGWHNKRWTTRSGSQRGGRPFNKGTLHYLLSNVTYVGKVRYRGQLYEGEQEAIVCDELFMQVADLLNGNRRSRGQAQPGRYRGWLEKLLYCQGCQSGMIHTYSARKQRRYRYYVCSSAQKNGHHTCETGMLPAAQIERVVAEELQALLPELEVADPDQIPVTRLVRRVDYDGHSRELTIQLRKDIIEGYAS